MRYMASDIGNLHCLSVSVGCLLCNMLAQVRLRPGDMSFAQLLDSASADSQVQAHIADAYDVTNILFSSGTTGTHTLLCFPSCAWC